ncbi:MAG: AbrB/MazE/SpoVT family DNA-binding domain-containing protein [Acidobacteria bacterium]|nr:MAG: AbrB/MazE/SpoVT family DNA-binding domain-containing protein [Acidobacteriota bacterium]PYY22222.1 MAG: AbrB/MazE/SpoVT family DNA-binding domain-containing protein [Acidobacteriota bacterium]
MNVRVDKAGRIVLPKPLRDRLGLKAGSSLELSENSDGLLLRLAVSRSSLVKRNGRWVYTGKAPRDINWERLVEEDRELRDRELYER